MNPILYIVVPCYNEQEVLGETSSRLRDKLTAMMNCGLISNLSRVLFVDDGSKDETWNMISQLHSQNKIFSGLKLAHNRGQQNALLAGLMSAKAYADCVISLDADLQDDIEVMDKFIQKFNEGCDIVYGVRSTRNTDTFFKKFTAEVFYKFMKVLGVDIINNHADYRLMSRRALEALSEYGEVNLFLRGIVPTIGYKTDIVYYERHERFAGQSKYPIKKMIALAIDGITSFSVKPLNMISGMGIFLSFVSIIGLIYSLISYFAGWTVPGWTTTVCSIWLLGGIQLFCIGVLGCYVGKIYFEVKKRPRYWVDMIINDNDTALDVDKLSEDIKAK